MATFAVRYGLTVETIAARLGLEVGALQAFDQAGGPGWLRLALVGVAVERGESAAALAWLLDAPAPETRAVGEACGGPDDRPD